MVPGVQWHTQSLDLVGGKSATGKEVNRMHKYNVCHTGKAGRYKAEPIPEEIKGVSTDQGNKTGVWFLHWVRMGFAGQKPNSQTRTRVRIQYPTGAAAKMSSIKLVGE